MESGDADMGTSVTPPPAPGGVQFQDTPPPPPNGVEFQDDSGFHPLDAAKNTISNWWDSVKHGPANLYDTGKAIAGLATGDTEKQMGQQNADLWGKARDAWNQGDYAGAAAHTLNYALNGIPGVGSALDDAGESFRQGDVSGGVGKTLGLATNLVTGAKLPELASDAVNLPGKIAGSTKLPERMYQSALKPRTTMPRAQRQQLIQTGLNEQIPVSAAGMEKAGNLSDTINDDISNIIRPHAAAGDTIDPNSVATRINQTRPTFENQVNPDADVAAIDASKDEFLRNQGARPGAAAVPPSPTGLLNPNGRPIMSAGTPAQPPTPAQPLPVDEAQNIKQGTYRQIRKSYGKLSDAQTEAQKSLARGIKEELAAKYPELTTLNDRDGGLLKLHDSIDKAVARIDNHQLFGIGTPLAAAGGAAATGSPVAGLAIGAARAMLDQPEIKSNLAIALRNAANKPMSTRANLSISDIPRVAATGLTMQDNIARRMGRQISQANLQPPPLPDQQ